MGSRVEEDLSWGREENMIKIYYMKLKKCAMKRAARKMNKNSTTRIYIITDGN